MGRAPSQSQRRPNAIATVGPRQVDGDNFGDVFGIFLAITGDGYSFPELRRYAEFLRRELLLVDDVKSVELFGQQQEVVFLEISRQRLAQLGINEEQIYSQLQARNVAADGGGATLLMWLIMPLAIIGLTAGLLLTGMPFTFMALLGILSLGGELIKMQIVVLSKIRGESDQGKSPYQAILVGGTAKMRPVCMVVITTVLGMIPLLKDPFFGAMAVCLMFGLTFAAVLSLIVMPALYAIMFNIQETRRASASDW